MSREVSLPGMKFESSYKDKKDLRVIEDILLRIVCFEDYQYEPSTKEHPFYTICL